MPAGEFVKNLNNLVIYGRNTVVAAIKSKQSIEEILLYREIEKEFREKIKGLCKVNGYKISYLDREKLSQIAQNEKNQGICAKLKNFELKKLRTLLEDESNPKNLALVLDSINDPQNLGSILRTCAAAGVNLVVLNRANSCPLTSTVFKVSQGGIFHVPICIESNIYNSLDLLKKSGFWLYGFEGDGESLYHEVDLKGKVALVFGSEGEGLRKLTRKTCDFTLKIPVLEEISSLNVSISAALGVFEVLKQRSKVQK